MLYGCVTWIPRACHYDTLRRFHHSFLTRCISWRENNRTEHPKTGSESILKRDFTQEADLIRRICREYGGHETAKWRNVRRADGEPGLRGGTGKVVDGVFLDDLRAFGINADPWTTVAQDEREWRKTKEKRAEHLMAKWVAAEKARAGLWHATVCVRT